METKENKKEVWVVMENCRTKHSDETTDCLEVFESKESAEAFLVKCKDSICGEWADAFWEDENGERQLEEDWEIEEDRPTHFTLARTTDYEYYYSVWISSYELKK